jgi:hypothetical protein
MDGVKTLGFGLGDMMADARGGNALNPTYGIYNWPEGG